MKTVGIIGTRGIPNRYGGFERFVEVLVRNEIFQGGVNFVVYGQEKSEASYQANVRLRFAGTIKDDHPFLYYGMSASRAVGECDVILSCGAGISIYALYCRLKGCKVVTNIDGVEWRRTKWSRIGRAIIYLMYLPALAFSNSIVIDAKALRRFVPRMYQDKVSYIPYQAPKQKPLVPLNRTVYEKSFALCVCRLEPENNLEMILRGWSKSKLRFPLYIVGDTSTKYFSSVLQVYGKENVHFLGPIFDLEELDSLRTNCDIYLHGHSVGGTNPSLLEALVYCSGKLLCHDNEFNREVAQDSASYFSCEDDHSALLSATSEKRSLNSPWFRGPFEEDEVARKYFELLVED